MDVQEKTAVVLELMQKLHYLNTDFRERAMLDFGIEGADANLDWLYARLTAALIEQSTLISLLVDKGLITNDEYFDRLIARYKEETEGTEYSQVIIA